VERRSSGPLTRRGFLSGLGASAFATGISLASPMTAGRAEASLATRTVSMVHQRTDESFAMQYHDGNGYLEEALEAFSHFARDLHAEAETTMDVRLMDLVYMIQRNLDDDSPLILTNGYRTQATNARTRRAASASLHVEGRALDIAHPRVGISELHRAAAQINHGGLGRYRSFIHIDTGPDRRW
jgi:uncharacterized protein YcbK (DUF882 family)